VRHRLTAIIAVSILSLAFAGSALAFDCIRVSSSLKGLQQSTRSGHWLLFDFSTAAGVSQTFANNFEQPITAAQSQCMATEYAKANLPLYFALGLGVAGPNGELAHNNKNLSVLTNSKGIDHFEDGGIIPALITAAGTCGVPVS
jgi:hypothetical protein